MRDKMNKLVFAVVVGMLAILTGCGKSESSDDAALRGAYEKAMAQAQAAGVFVNIQPDGNGKRIEMSPVTVQERARYFRPAAFGSNKLEIDKTKVDADLGGFMETIINIRGRIPHLRKLHEASTAYRAVQSPGNYTRSESAVVAELSEEILKNLERAFKDFGPVIEKYEEMKKQKERRDVPPNPELLTDIIPWDVLV
jgi:hypothetical protein